jgi:hypothetical protein
MKCSGFHMSMEQLTKALQKEQVPSSYSPHPYIHCLAIQHYCNYCMIRVHSKHSTSHNLLLITIDLCFLYILSTTASELTLQELN